MKSVLSVGLGSMGRRRIRNLQHLGATEQIVGYDPRPDRREAAESEYGIRTFADFDQALATEPDVLVISTPPDLHMQYALIAAKNDKHFFIEHSVIDDGMDEVIALCQGKRFVAAPSCTMRFHPSIRVVKELVDDNAIGPVLTFTYHVGQYLPDWHPWEDYRSFYVSKRRTGACREIVAFEFNWLTWIFGEVDLVSGLKGKLTDLDTDIDDAYQILMRFQQGTLGHMLVDVISRVPYRTCRLMGERGVIEWSWTDKVVRVFDAETGSWNEYIEPEGTAMEGYLAAEDHYIAEMKSFVDAVSGEAEYPYTLAEDKRNLSLLYAAERSANEMVHVRTDPGATG